MDSCNNLSQINDMSTGSQAAEHISLIAADSLTRVKQGFFHENI